MFVAEGPSAALAGTDSLLELPLPLFILYHFFQASLAIQLQIAELCNWLWYPVSDLHYVQQLVDPPLVQ